MLFSLTAALRHVRSELADLMEPVSLTELCRSAGMRWRDRILDPVSTIQLFLLQLLHGNAACARLPRLTGLAFTASTYCQARSQLPLAICQELLTRLVRSRSPLTDEDEGWLGHRVWLIDGTGVGMPDTPDLQRAFGQPTNQAEGCGFPVARLLILFHAGTGLLRRVIATPLRSYEMSSASLVHPEMGEGDVLVGDRAFGTFAHLALLARSGLHGVFRMSQRRVVDFTPDRKQPPRWNTPRRTGRARSRQVRTLGPTDQVVQWYKPYERPSWMSTQEYATLPVMLTVRESRYTIARPGFRVRTVTLVSTRLDGDTYPLEELARLYRDRWDAETNLAHLKTTLGMDVLRCQTEVGGMREITLFAVAYNLVRSVMWEASRRQRVPVKRISFVDALRWLADSPPGSRLPRLIVNPSRSGRSEPRSQKRRAKKYPYMKRPRHVLKQELTDQQVAT